MEYKHFSHPHRLKIHHLHKEDGEIQCSGCESICTDAVYACRHCNYFLHRRCGDAPRALTHPSHPAHHLTLLPSATYPDASFICNACGATGSSFCFSCAPCNLDLHLHCALLPLHIRLRSHPHNLSLVFSPPKGWAPPAVCYLCRRAVDFRYWSYCCRGCGFYVHTFCAESKLQAAGEERIGSDGLSLEKSEPVTDRGVRRENLAQAPVVEDPILKAQAELHEMQMQLQIANEMAKMMASFNLSSLV